MEAPNHGVVRTLRSNHVLDERGDLLDQLVKVHGRAPGIVAYMRKDVCYQVAAVSQTRVAKRSAGGHDRRLKRVFVLQ